LEDANDYKNHYHEYDKVSRAWDDVGDPGWRKNPIIIGTVYDPDIGVL
jgi:hypothetical protein